MYKSCSKCGKIHSDKRQCEIVRSFNGGNERKLRSTYSWTKASLRVRESAHYLCEVCKDKGVYTYNNIEVHHIVKVRDDESKLTDDENLICLCQEHHKQADNGEIDKNYLIDLAKRRVYLSQHV